ncbi:MAG: hypothetical protein FD146_742 [Anaerolineaceae bacterium]|nr:MAG: hypothetical protein FD146_742 [Anaerolineaceae bacterium]
MTTLTKNRKQPRPLMVIAVLVATAILGIFVYLYRYEPLPLALNDYLIYGIILLAAIAAAAPGTFLAAQFEHSEPPRRVWMIFTAGWWFWVLGELLGFYYRAKFPDGLPELTLIDLCWTVGYLLFGLALYYQFRLIYGNRSKTGLSRYFIIVGFTLLLTLGLTTLARRSGLGEGYTWFSTYLSVFYPVCDLMAGIAAIWLSILFGRGLWGRPWWGLIAFAVADSINIFDWLGGLEAFPVNTQNILYLASDTLYTLGYIIVALAFLSSYWLVSYPPAGGSQPVARNAPAS